MKKGREDCACAGRAILALVDKRMYCVSCCIIVIYMVWGGGETDLDMERELLAAIPLLFLPMVRYFLVCGAVVVSAIPSKYPCN